MSAPRRKISFYVDEETYQRVESLIGGKHTLSSIMRYLLDIALCIMEYRKAKAWSLYYGKRAVGKTTFEQGDNER